MIIREYLRAHLHAFQYIFYILVIGNLFFLNFWVINQNKTSASDKLRMIGGLSYIFRRDKELVDNKTIQDYCNEACIQAMYQNIRTATMAAVKNDAHCDDTCIKNINKRIDAISSNAAVSVGGAPIIQINEMPLKEVFIPIGSGFSSAGDWTDVPGLSVSIDSVNYRTITAAFFEATIRIPTGNETAYARLYNATAGHPVWGSEISVDGGTPTLLTAPITIDSGKNIYQIQMKTSLKYQANIDQARMRLQMSSSISPTATR
jgi:hypothetical protein